jgi:hypothetical protein
MGDFLLMILTVFAVGVGGYGLGRLAMRDRIEALLDELDCANDLVDQFLRVREHPSSRDQRHLRAVRGDGP